MVPNHRAVSVPLGHMAKSSWKPQGKRRPDIRWVVWRETCAWYCLILLRTPWILIQYHWLFTKPKLLTIRRFYLFTTFFFSLSPRHPRKGPRKVAGENLWAQQLADSAVDAQHAFAGPARAYALHRLRLNMARKRWLNTASADACFNHGENCHLLHHRSGWDSLSVVVSCQM